MGRILGRVFRPTVVGVVSLVLIAGGGTVTVLSLADRAPAIPAAAAADAADIGAFELGRDLLPGPHDPPKLLAAPTPTPAPPKPKPVAKPKPRKATPKPRPPAGPNLAPFKGLGAWVDLYDEELDPEATAVSMASRGVKTLYLQTGRYNVPGPNSPESFPPGWIDPWVHAAHAHGLKVIGWYLPAYDDMARDVRRTVAIATYRTPKGQRFDGLGIDAEYRRYVAKDAWMVAVVHHAAAVRKAVGRTVAVAGIVQPPLLMDTAPDYWAGFNWRGLAASVNLFMPMAYWTTTEDDCKSSADYCAYGYTKRNVEEIRRRTGSSRMMVHVIGGIGDACTTAQVADYVRAALAAGSSGGSLYDFGVTKPEWWTHLARLNH
jgi:hypothetical protein